MKSREAFRVLVVDDNSDVASLLAEALHDVGYDTTAEYDGRSALQAWRRFTPHAGVFDVGLPDLDGYELAREIRAQHGRAPVLIAATGYGQPASLTDFTRRLLPGPGCRLSREGNPLCIGRPRMDCTSPIPLERARSAAGIGARQPVPRRAQRGSWRARRSL
jgi:CheY-like chemotaxis protein